MNSLGHTEPVTGYLYLYRNDNDKSSPRAALTNCDKYSDKEESTNLDRKMATPLADSIFSRPYLDKDIFCYDTVKLIYFISFLIVGKNLPESR